MKKLLLLAAVFSLCLSQTQAALDMFLKIEGPLVKGESKDKVHAGEVDVLAWSWGISNSGSAQIGGGAGTGKANFQDLSLTKYVDSSTPALMKAVATGSHFGTVTLVVRKPGTIPVEYIKIIMTEVLVTSLSTGGSGGEDRLTENISLNFAKVHVDYVPVDASGKPAAAIPFDFDIAANVAQ